MDFYINLKVNFRGNSKNFLLSGSETKSWESMEAMVKRSFGLCSLQLTYFDEENEEVSINSQAEYEEALKSAVRQGNRLHMNVYETRGQPTRVATTKASGAEPKRGFRPPQHCPSLAQVVSRKVQAAVPEQGMVIMKEVKGTKEEDKTPPAWFTSYMEKFKDQVVREAVEKICREFSGQCCIHKPLGGGGGAAGGAGAAGGGRVEAVGGAETQQVPEVSSSTLPGAPSSSTPPCSSCRGQTTGGGYQCSVCTSCTLCEPCSFSHDPSHNLVRARTPLSIPEHGSPAPDHSRFYRRGDRSFRKAEKQRLKAEKRLLKAEVKEIRKQLRMERRGIQWSSSHRDGSSSPVLLQPRATQHNSPERPKRPCPLVVPAMTAAFLDENLPDGTRLRPGTKFIKYWKMRNTGTLSWSAETKLKFMWGNLAVGSGDRWREVAVPFLQPGQVGIVSVALCAPTVEGSYTSHWRLAHAGEQFGPRVWCSIVVDPLAPAAMMADGILVSPCVTPQGKNPVAKDGKACAASREQPLLSVDQEEYYIPSVDLLTAQDLLSFELLDINIVQELESAPTNTPAGEAEESHMESICVEPRVREKQEEEEKRDVMRSRSSSTSSEDYIIILPDCFDTTRPLGESMYSSALSQPGDVQAKTDTDPDTPSAERRDSAAGEGEADEVDEAAPGMELSGASSANDMLCTSQTLDDEPLTPEVVTPPQAVVTSHPESSAEREEEDAGAEEGAQGSELHQTEDEAAPERAQTDPEATDTEKNDPEDPRQQGLTGGLVKGALSVAASAYKALFTGQGPTQPPVDASTQDTMMAVLVEMGFADRSLNQRLLKKHNYNLLDVVNELVQMTDNDWYSTRY
ncbi:next to BRCA1 gene 1 protein isoform X3 [Astatotilapia calliptera]|uniref:next to BRCA1 gene 1 protein isoform X3 n=1 Tax=Astatotilapia calliptera TaxID=8154 RepID=UPI000646E460|nr:next to BRCA1 gene 1 protein isoform X3 [Maylandia zebra]XP_026042060.1 next to BRCA1 gene 1 protein-like isoform X3 [Astatotilapia calliptera]